MQGVGSDPTAIEDILSGERQSANTGARIKHSTGKAATIAATAAVIAICAGIGFSNMNANDDSSIKPAAATTTTAVTPAKQAAQSFKLEATSMTAAPLGARTVLTLTATDEKGREIIQKYGSKDVAKNSIWLGGNESTQRPEIIDSTGFHHEWHDDCRVAEVGDDQMTFIYDTYLLFEAANEAMPFTVNVFCPDENKQPTADQLANGEQGNLSIIASAKLSYKVNAAEQVFTSANGEVFRVSDFYFYTNHEDKNNLSNLLFDMKFNFANSTQRSFVEQELSHLDQFGTDTLCIGGGYINGEYKLLHFFNDSINSDEVTSIIYDGVEFTPQGDAKISIEKNIDEAKKAYIEATIEKQKLIKKNPNANTKEYDSAMIEAAKYIAQNKGSDILCAGLTSDKHFIAAACFSGNNAQKVKACADKMAQQGIRYNWFILIDKSGNELCKCYIDWCHMISGNAYVQIYSENAVSFAALPDGAVLRCLTDSSFADINVSLTDGDLGTTLFNNIKQ